MRYKNIKRAAFFLVLFFLPSISSGAGKNAVTNIRIGTYDGVSRVVFDMSDEPLYNVVQDKESGVISILFMNTVINVTEKRLKDKRIKGISLKNREEMSEVKITYNDIKSPFFYSLLSNPNRFVVDIKDSERDIKQLKLDDYKQIEEGLKDNTISFDEKKVTTAVKEGDEEAKPIKPQAKADILYHSEEYYAGKEEYKRGLAAFQEGRYSEAINILQLFTKAFSKSGWRDDALFLTADGYFNIAKETNKANDYMKAIDAYKTAIREYDDYMNKDYAYYRIWKGYMDVGFFSEAEVMVDIILKEFPKTRYEQGIRFGRVEMLLQDKKFTEAYNEYKRGDAVDPLSIESRDALFMIADMFFKEKAYIISQRLYEDGMKRWPDHAKGSPAILKGVGFSLLENGRLKEGRDILFSLVNIYFDSEYTKEALIRLGDYYRNTGDNKSGLKLYVEVVARKEKDDKTILGNIRMAETGVLKPDIEMKNTIFDYNPYINPIPVYENIIKENPDKEVAVEALLKKGVALSKGAKYLDAIVILKDMIKRYPDSSFAKEGEDYLRDILIKLADTYYSQEGYFPLILAYHKSADPFLKDISDIIFLDKLAESYFKMGIYDLAEEKFDRLSQLDKKGDYADKINLRRAEIKFSTGEYAESEKLLLEFIKKYGKSDYYLNASVLLGDVLYKQGRFDNAREVYMTALNKYPKDPEILKYYYKLAKTLFSANNYNEAIGWFDKILSGYKPSEKGGLAPAYVMDSYYYKADSVYRAGDYNSAVTALNDALRFYPNDEWLEYLIGKSYERMDKMEDAKVVYKKLSSANTLIASVAKTDLSNIEWFAKNAKGMK